MKEICPELPLWVVSDFPPEDKTLKWIPFRNARSFFRNLSRLRAAVKGKSIRLAAVMLVPDVPFRRMRLMAFVLAPRAFIAFNENLDNFMLRPRSVPGMLRHMAWRIGNRLRASPVKPPADEQPPPAFSAAYPGKPATGKPRILILSPYLPFPLSHGGAVRMYNLMRRCAAETDQILIAFTTPDSPRPPDEVLAICVETVLVPHAGRHEFPDSGRPDVVEEYDSAVFRQAVHDALRRWRPKVVQMEFTQMAQYADLCLDAGLDAGARTLLVEHDITFDLFEQRARRASPDEDRWEIRYQLRLWHRFERAAWRRMDRVVVMSGRDQRLAGDRAVVVANGVDLERYQPTAEEPDPRRLLFIGSFGHLPNLLALEFFLNRVWPLLDNVTLHIVAGARHEHFLDFHRHQVPIRLDRPGLEIEGFVSDPRPAYRRATLAIAPLLASAGTNIKVLEAMAMGRVTVSTTQGINGLDLSPGRDVVIADTPEAFASAITGLLDSPERRKTIEAEARRTVERDFGWDPIARRQCELYRELMEKK